MCKRHAFASSPAFVRSVRRRVSAPGVSVGLCVGKLHSRGELFHLLLAAIPTPLPANIPKYTRQDAEEVSIRLLSGTGLPLVMDLTSCSGIARSLRASAYRPALRHAFQPRVAAPIISQRFASSGVGDGKIHQVIGAVVDGTSLAPLVAGEKRRANTVRSQVRY